MTSPTPPPAPPAAGPVPPVRRADRRRWWLIGGAAAWALVLLGLALLSVRRDPPSVPEQRDLAAVLPALDRATAAVLAAVGSDGVVEFGPVTVTRGCRITPVRDGAEATRDVTVHVRPGAGPTALRRIAAGLPDPYGARVGYSGGSGGGGSQLLLRADAGDFIAVHGATGDDSSLVSVRSSTGCRPDDAGGTPTEPPARSIPAALRAALTALRVPGTGATARELRCPDGGTARTVTVHAGADPVGMGAALAAVTTRATVVEARAGAYAYRVGDESVLVGIVGDQLRIIDTTNC